MGESNRNESVPAGGRPRPASGRRKGPRGFPGYALTAVGILLLAGGITTVLLLVSSGGGGVEVPDVVGETFARAKESVIDRGFSIELDPLQDSSSAEHLERLEVNAQDPKPGTRGEKGEVVTVTLEGLEYVGSEGRSSGESETTTAEGTAPEEQGAQAQEEAAAQTSPQPATETSRRFTVCLDPGHSVNSPASEIDQATGLNVADNGGADGEIQAMWELALKAKSRLEQLGYGVVLTKESADSCVNLRRRADIGNTCSVVVRLHYDPSLQAILYPGEGQYKENAGRRVMVDPGVAAASGVLARTLQPFMSEVGISRVDNDMGGTSGNSGPAFVGSVLSTVPVVLIENDPGLVRNNPEGQDRVADTLARGISAYLQGR